MRYSVIIPNWNGAQFIARALAAVEAAMREAGGAGELLVVDDASEDDSPDLIERRFPQARLISQGRNLGFAATVNHGLEEADAPLVILLNNDVVVRSDFIARVLRPFAQGQDNESLFAVTAKTLQWSTGEPNHICMNGRWLRGRIELMWSDPAEPCPALFLQAGACAIRLDRALELGGLRDLYRPGYWEDYDLSYRAAKRGWTSLYDGAAVAYHLGKASMERRYGDDGVRALRLRNELLFLWANLDEPALIASHARSLLPRICRDLARGRLDSLKAVTQAFTRLPEVLRLRRAEVVRLRRAGADRRTVVSDSTLLTPNTR